MLWGAAVAHMIDGKVARSSLYFFICAFLTSFGLIHSGVTTGGLYPPWQVPDPMVYHVCLGYISMAAILFLLSISERRSDKVLTTATRKAYDSFSSVSSK
jgi:AGZA family xanthine/uracil permease-like MFS transporter